MAPLPSNIVEMLMNYFSHRARSQEYALLHWDKDADLNSISEACNEEGYTYSAVAGTFWIRERKTGRVFKVSEESGVMEIASNER